MLEFSEKGYLNPEGIVECDWETFSNTFAFNEVRKKLLNDFSLLIDELKFFIATNFYVWIDGSFISKKNFPNDIDVVIFINYTFYEDNEITLRIFHRKWTLLDCYFVKLYPTDHPSHYISIFDKTEWLHLFSTDRKRNRKGFIQINF